MKKILFLFAVTMGLFASTSAHAMLLVEPSLGYEMSTLDGASKGKASGVGFGARLGYQVPVMGLWFAADYAIKNGLSFKNDTSGQPDGKIDNSELYVDVGFDFPVMLRAWFGYGVMSDVKYKGDTGSESKMTEPTFYKLGVGFTALPVVSINLEYYNREFKKSETGGTSFTLNPTQKETAYMLSVSAPFHF